jgi:hypothetical protein
LILADILSPIFIHPFELLQLVFEGPLFAYHLQYCGLIDHNHFILLLYSTGRAVNHHGGWGTHRLIHHTEVPIGFVCGVSA